MRNENDQVVEAPWCCVCRRSSPVKWKKHIFTKNHQQCAREYLLLRIATLNEIYAQIEAKDDTTSSDAVPQMHTKWHCGFCEVNDSSKKKNDESNAGEEGNTIDGIEACVAHFASDLHRKQVDAFCRHHQCDTNRQLRKQLVITPGKRRYLMTAYSHQQKQLQDKHQQVKAMEKKQIDEEATSTFARTQEFLNSAAARLQEVTVQGEYTNSPVNHGATSDVDQSSSSSLLLMGPQFRSLPRMKTLTSPDGVLQHPLGRHEGRRVWGGGIIKVKKSEWIPWAIDLFVIEEQGKSRSYIANGSEGDTTFTHRVTEAAYGEGLGQIVRVGWGDNIANIHTAAVPPWMVQSEDEYRRCNIRNDKSRAQAAEEPPKKDIFAKLQAESAYGPDWLPNFGGVWHEGPRSKTKQHFQREISSESPTPQKFSVPYQPRRSSAPSSAYEPRRAQPMIDESNKNTKTHDAKTPVSTQSIPQSMNSLDAKKQMLLAQKDRLRAKLAAKKRG